MTQVDISGLQLTNSRKITTVRAQGEYIKKKKRKGRGKTPKRRVLTWQGDSIMQIRTCIKLHTPSKRKKERKLKARYFEMNIMQLSSIRCKELAMHFSQHIYNMNYVI